MGTLGRLERLLRSRCIGYAFSLINKLTRYEIVGGENLKAAVARSKERGTGLITISNHVSLFDDPLVIAEVLGLKTFDEQNKIWHSTPCATNFSPSGKGLWARFVRYFSDVASMVFMERIAKGARPAPLPDSFSEVLRARARDADAVLAELENRSGRPAEEILRGFLTPGGKEVASLNQLGMIEACARVNAGGWLHFFPEGGRSRSLELRRPRRGVGKVIAHCPEAEVLPLCFYGMQDVLPVGKVRPRFFQRVVVSVGEPVPAARLEAARRAPAGKERYKDAIEAAWQSVVELRPDTLARYLGEKPLLTTAPAPRPLARAS